MQWGIRMWCGGQTLKYIYDYIIIQYMIILLQTIIPDHAGPPRIAFII